MLTPTVLYFSGTWLRHNHLHDQNHRPSLLPPSLLNRPGPPTLLPFHWNLHMPADIHIPRPPPPMPPNLLSLATVARHSDTPAQKPNLQRPTQQPKLRLQHHKRHHGRYHHRPAHPQITSTKSHLAEKTRRFTRFLRRFPVSAPSVLPNTHTIRQIHQTYLKKTV